MVLYILKKAQKRLIVAVIQKKLRVRFIKYGEVVACIE